MIRAGNAPETIKELFKREILIFIFFKMKRRYRFLLFLRIINQTFEPLNLLQIFSTIKKIKYTRHTATTIKIQQNNTVHIKVTTFNYFKNMYV